MGKFKTTIKRAKNKIKILLRSDLSKNAWCLANKNVHIPEFVKYSDFAITGQIWDANKQCQMILGPKASFYQVCFFHIE